MFSIFFSFRIGYYCPTVITALSIQVEIMYVCMQAMYGYIIYIYIMLNNFIFLIQPITFKTYISLLTGYLLEPRLCCETIRRDMFWSYLIMTNWFIVLLIEYVSRIRISI